MSSITELQAQLYPLLGNIDVIDVIGKEKPIGKFNISDTTDENIYKIPENQPNLDIDKYRQFLEFMIRELTKNNVEFSKNTGEILTAHYLETITKEDKDEIDKIKKEYEKLYFDKYRPPHKKYPNWKTELLEKSRTVLYKNQEQKLGITNILKQSNDEFLETIKKRKDGLQKCASEETDNNKFYNEESIKLTRILEDKSLETNDKISKLCNNTFWGKEVNDYETGNLNPETKKKRFQDFKTFIKSNPNELEYLKTFLPENLFNDDDNTKLWNNIEIFYNNDKTRSFRQYVFGYGSDTLKYHDYKSFFELYNIDYNPNEDREPCSILVKWNIILNMYYNKCALSNNKPFFPIRFVFPTKDFNKVEGKNDTYNHRTLFKVDTFIKDEINTNKYK